MAAKISLPRTSANAISYANLLTIFRILANNISRLDLRHCTTLIFAILNIPKWYHQDEQFINNYITFLCVLVSGIPKWYNEVCLVFIKDFVTPHTSAHHEFFKYLIRIMPTSLNFLLKAAISNFPDKYSRKSEVVNYVSNLFEFMKYATEVRFQILSLIVEYCIQLDVELKNNLDEVDEEDDDDDDDDDEEDDDDDDDEEEEDSEDDDGENSSDEEDDEDEANVNDTTMNEDNEEGDDDEDEELEGQEEYNVDLTVNINELSAKLDSVMEKIFINLQDSFTLENLNNGDGITIFRSLLSIFKSYILSTSNTRSIQFILFHFSQQQPELIDAFLVTLIDITFSYEESLEQRIKAVQYLASYLARGKKVTQNQLVFVTSYLVSWINKYVSERECEVGNGNGGMERFKLFYAVLQCLLYIFCFRHQQLHKLNGDWECGIDKFFQKLILTKFNPLKFCNETVVLMFAKIAHQENVAYCFSIIEHNRRDQFNGAKSKSGSSTSNGSTFSISQKQQQKQQQQQKSNAGDSKILFFSKQEFLDLVAYFPFDPLILKKCLKIVKENYIEWSELGNDYDSDSNSDDYDDGASYAREFVRKNSVRLSNNEKARLGELRKESNYGGDVDYDSDVFDSD